MRPFKSEKAEGCLQFYVTCNGSQLCNKATNTRNYKKVNSIYVYIYAPITHLSSVKTNFLYQFIIFFLTSLFHLNFTKV